MSPNLRFWVGVNFPPWRMEEEVLWTGGALLVTLSVIYLEFKAHLTSMATTAFWSDIPSSDIPPPGCVRAILPRRRVIERRWPGVQMSWPPQFPPLNHIEMVWDELDRKVKEKQATSAQNMWELLQDCCKSILGEPGWQKSKSVQSSHQGKGWLLWRISNIKC